METLELEGFGARLAEAIGDESVNSFAKRCEVSEGSIRNYLKDKIPGADIALRIADTAGVDFEWLVSGRGSKRLPPGADFVLKTPNGALFIEAKSRNLPDFSLVPRLDVSASAGSGVVPYTEDPLEYLAFQSDWLRSRGINANAARILTARGDSMEETIRDGDTLLVDTSIDRVKDNAIYVVSYGEMVLVKRIHGRLNGSLQLISDNPRYPPEEVAAGEVTQLNVAGRVMWFGRFM
jgi:phage repressor protein C with HTH and peptisase S24 domain